MLFQTVAKFLATFHATACFMNQMSPHPSRGRTWRNGENMNLQTGEKRIFGKSILAAAVLVGMLAFAGTPRASAEDYDRCQRRIAKADHKLHEAAEHHGWNERHRWWDEDGHRWHSDRDWDDHDHDRH